MMTTQSKVYTEELKNKHIQFFESRKFDDEKKMIDCDWKLREELFKTHENLIFAVISPRSNSEARQEAAIALLKAIDRFDPNMGTTFSTFAFSWLNQAVLLSWSEPIPSAIKRMKVKIFSLIKQDVRYVGAYEEATTYSQRNDLLIKYMTNHEAEIVQKLGYTPYQLLQINAYHTYRSDLNIDDYVEADVAAGEDEESKNYTALLDVMASASVDCLKKLTVKQRQLVLLRLGLIQEPLEESKWFGEKDDARKHRKTKKNVKTKVVQP